MSSAAPASSAMDSSAPRPLAAMPRTCSCRLRIGFGGSGGGVTTSKGPIDQASRYVGSGSVVAKRIDLKPEGSCFCSSSLVLATAMSAAGTVRVTSKGVLNAGSSKQGKALRASIASNCVKA